MTALDEVLSANELRAENERLRAALNRISNLQCGALNPSSGLEMFEIARDIAREAQS
jgi:hypothetical protein